MDKTNIGELIKSVCKENNLEFENSSKHKYRIYTDEASGINLNIEVDDDAEYFSFYFFARTHDIVYWGDRSDAHVILSLMFASFLRLIGSGISCSFFDVPHPVVDDEIYGRYIMPDQAPILAGLSSTEDRLAVIQMIIVNLSIWREIFWSFASCPCDHCLQENHIKRANNSQNPDQLIEVLDKVYTRVNHLNYGGRLRPNWKYLYDMDHEITIIESLELCHYVEKLQDLRKSAKTEIEAINGTIILDGELKHIVSKKSISKFHKLFKQLTGKTALMPKDVITFENMLLYSVKPYIVALGSLSGIEEYTSERELIRKRHNIESQLLFPISIFDWNDQINPEEFEKLIRSLLEREPMVKLVKRPAPTNQGDKGRDLLIEWYITNPYVVSQHNPPLSLINVVGQCKVSTKTVGKSKVQDIRDTVETHNSNGFFLAVSNQISAAMTEKLEQLRNKGIWTEWWTREDIEDRLSKNQDLIPHFPSVLKVKGHVKFIEKDTNNQYN